MDRPTLEEIMAAVAAVQASLDELHRGVAENGERLENLERQLDREREHSDAIGRSTIALGRSLIASGTAEVRRIEQLLHAHPDQPLTPVELALVRTITEGRHHQQIVGHAAVVIGRAFLDDAVVEELFVLNGEDDEDDEDSA